MAKKNYPDEFKRDAVALYRDTEGATLTAIAAELGIRDVTLAPWCKAAGVAIRHRKSASATAEPCPGVETPEQELAWPVRYNTKRRHSHCHHSSPATYERTHIPATLPEAE